MTHDAVASVFSETKDLDVEVIVIDNNSPDESGPRLKASFSQNPNVHVIINQDNKGFSAANNQGATHAKGRLLFFLNPDTLLHTGALNVLTEFLTSMDDAGAVGPRVLNTDGTDQISVAPFATTWTILQHHLPFLGLFKNKQEHPILTDKIVAVDVIKGCALMISRKVFDKIGGWDERYFMYSEETELCLSLVNAGYTNYFVQDAVITHHGGQSTMDQYAEQQVVQQRSALQFLRRHHGTSTRVMHRISGLLGFGGRALLFPLAALFKPSKADNYKLRGEAASRLFRWFLFDYS